jgi:hypothetical protein
MAEVSTVVQATTGVYRSGSKTVYNSVATSNR